MRSRPLLVASCALATLAWAADASAQDTGPAPPAAAAATTVGEVIVTAQKRSENLEKVPLAVSAFTSKDRDRIGVDTIQDIANFTPGLEYSTVLDRAFLRGVGRQTNNLSEDPGVATYADGVYNSSVVAAAGDSLLVDRVEVLRGPQGTLYGRNSIGGAINSVSRRPTKGVYAEGRVNIGDYDVYNAEAAVSGPLADGLQARLAAYDDNQNQGYFRNLSGMKSEGGRGNSQYVEGQLQGRPTPDFEFWAKLSYFRYNSSYRSSNTVGSIDYAPFPPGVLSPTAGFGLTIPGVITLGPTLANNPGNRDIRTIDTDTPSRANLSGDYSGDLQLTYHLPFADLKYTGGYTIYRYGLTTDADGTSVSSYPFTTTTGLPPLLVRPTAIEGYVENKHYDSNELDLASTGIAALQWIVGLYQYGEGYRQSLDIFEPDQLQIQTPFLSASNPSGSIYHAAQVFHADSFAGFGQVDRKLNDQLKLTGGLRYTKDRKSGIESTRQLCFGLPACAPASIFGVYTVAIDVTPFLISSAPDPGVRGSPTADPTTGIISRGLSGRWDAFTGTAGVEWTPDRRTLAYARYSRGYKSGGFNAGTLLPHPEAAPETIDAYEAGVKEVFTPALSANLALFYYDYDALQIPLIFQPATGPAQTLLFNVGRSRSYGAELETNWRATPSLQFLLSYAYLDATIRSHDLYEDAVQPQSGRQDVSGQNLPQSPHNKLALNATYTWRFNAGSLALSGNYIYKDSSFGSIFDRRWYVIPAYSQVDLRAVFNDAADRYTVIAYCKNLTDVTAYDNVAATFVQTPAAGSPNYNQQAGLAPPRTFGVELQYRFR